MCVYVCEKDLDRELEEENARDAQKMMNDNERSI